MKREQLHPIRYLSFEEWEKLKSQKKNTRDDLIINLLYFTGCTVNELVNIKIKDIDFKEKILKIRKNTSRNNYFRQVYLSEKVIKKIRNYIITARPENYLLSTRQSKKMSTKRVRQIIQELCSMIKIKETTPQIIRYTHIAHAYKKNIPIDAIQKQVGIRRSRAIEIFNQLKITRLKDAYKEFEI